VKPLYDPSLVLVWLYDFGVDEMLVPGQWICFESVKGRLWPNMPTCIRSVVLQSSLSSFLGYLDGLLIAGRGM
jgi:hypothetical protein